MLAFRSSIFLYFVVLFTHFNSQWVKDSPQNINVVKNCPSDQGINFIVESYLNVKAVQVTTKNVSKYFTEVHQNSFSEKDNVSVFEITKVNAQVITTAIFCAVKSYLHLLQLF